MAFASQVLAANPHEILRRGLESGQAATAAAAVAPMAETSADARLALGFARFVVAVEHLGQGLYRHGLKTPSNPFLPILRLPLPTNLAPEPLDYHKLRAIYQRFLDDLAEARKSLLATDGAEGKLVLDLFAIRFNLTAAADTSASMSLNDFLGQLQARQRPLPARPAAVPDQPQGIPGAEQASPPQTWEVAFDRADALWLAGYTHMLSAMMEFIMAHDWQNTYDATGHLFFAGAKPSFTQIDPSEDATALGMVPYRDGTGLADQIALLHLIHWPAGDKVRMRAVREHIKAVVALSRDTWKAVLAETDDDRVWLPSPRQQSRAVTAMQITDETLVSWHKLLDQLDAILDGRLLVGHWRFSKGIDMRAFFEEPQPFDLVLFLTGHGAEPFLRDGPVIGMTWWQLWNRSFSNNFLGYLFYFN